LKTRRPKEAKGYNFSFRFHLFIKKGYATVNPVITTGGFPGNE
jgi:hypothetical protein